MGWHGELMDELRGRVDRGEMTWEATEEVLRAEEQIEETETRSSERGRRKIADARIFWDALSFWATILAVLAFAVFYALALIYKF